MNDSGKSTVGAGTAAPTVALDLRDAELECGDPALVRVRRAYSGLEAGQVIEVRSAVAEHAFLVRAWARQCGAALVGDRRIGAQTVLLVRKPY